MLAGNNPSGTVPMPLDPLTAFTIAAGLCAMAIGHTLRMSSIERREREHKASRRPPQEVR